MPGWQWWRLWKGPLLIEETTENRNKPEITLCCFLVFIAAPAVGHLDLKKKLERILKCADENEPLHIGLGWCRTTSVKRS